MVLITVVLCTTILSIVASHPAEETKNEPLKLPQVNVSNPYEVNNLNYYTDNTNSETEPETKHFRRTVNEFEKSVHFLDTTVKQVESLLNANTTLPRLTRGEILEIIDNLTKQDLQEEIKKNQTREQKAIMLVMPYTPDNDDDSKMQELFTKPPITKLIGEPPKSNEVAKNKRRRPPPYVPQGGFYGEVFVEPPPLETSLKPPKYERPPVVTQTPLVTTQKVTKEISTTPKQLYTTKTVRSTTEVPKIVTLKPSTEKPKYRRRSTTATSPRTISTTIHLPEYSTEVSVKIHTETNFSQRKRRPVKQPQRFSNHKYPDEESNSDFSNTGIKIIDSPQLGLSSSTRKPQRFTILPEFTSKRIEPFTLPSAPTTKSSRPHHFTTAKSILADVSLPQDFKLTLDELNFGDSLKNTQVKYDSVEDIPKAPPLKDNVKDLLASIGVLPSSSTTTSLPDISNVADSLSPDMKELLMSFGLLPNPNSKPTQSKGEEPVVGPSSAEITPDSYVQFKPLPDNGPTREEMEELLGRFGLGKSLKNNRQEKALNNKKPEKELVELPQVETGMLPDNMKEVLSDLGLVDRHGKKIRAEALQKTLEKQHVFNPNDNAYASQDELEKLNQLLDIIRQLEKLNGTATEEDLNKVDLKHLKELVGSLNKEEFVPLDEQDFAPNPVNYDYGVSKNEVKRQENSTTPSSSSSSTATSEVTATITASESSATTTLLTTTTTTTTESTNSNLKDLEDSFGGSSDVVSPTATLPPPTEAPKTGFYYLLDWNSFLDVDNQMGKRVNLRFQPKAGDPKRFYSVSVP